jgi:putative nucleotidyltransferase with HDIG domain
MSFSKSPTKSSTPAFTSRFAGLGRQPVKIFKKGEFRLLNARVDANGSRVEMSVYRMGRVSIAFAPIKSLEHIESNVGRVVRLRFEEQYQLNMPVLLVHEVIDRPKPINPLATPMPRWIDSNLMNEYNSFFQLVGSLHSEYRELVYEVFRDDKLFSGYFQHPASLGHHHNKSSGLFLHSLEVTQLCEQACSILPNVNKSLLLTAAILHDVGKTNEYAQASSGYTHRTQIGELEMHKVQGAQIIHLAGVTCSADPLLVAEVVHCVTAANGPMYMGLPQPKLKEHAILQGADGMSATADLFETKNRFAFDFDRFGGTYQPSETIESSPQNPRLN